VNKSQKISLVIPVYNEAKILSTFLSAIHKQTKQPSEIIFVDSASEDKSVHLIKKWREKFCRRKQRVRILINPGGLPGGNRNKGVRLAKGSWIAFLDVGIIPSSDWLSRLVACARTSKSKAIFSACRFEGNTSFSSALCGISAGCGTTKPVLPASLIHRSLFSQVGLFREDLRATEDLIWLKQLKRSVSSVVFCNKAFAIYNQFPKNIIQVVKKYWVYEKCGINSGVSKSTRLLTLFGFGMLAVLLFIIPLIGIELLLFYIFLRGICDPIRRSHDIIWWGKYPSAALTAIWLGPFIDVIKVLVILHSGWFWLSRHEDLSKSGSRHAA